MDLPTTPQVATKLPHVGTTIFTVMSQLAQDTGAINLSQGFPDFSPDPSLIALVHEHMQQGHNQYAPMPGLPALREQLAAKLHDQYGTTVSPEQEITITSGATEALYAAIAATVQEGDEVIVLEPAYDSYLPAIKLNGGIAITIPLEHPAYSVDWEMVKKRMNHRTRMIIINSPHNPTGAILTKTDLQELEKLVAGTDVLVLSDEVYDHIVFDDIPHESVLRYPELYKHSFAVFSFGKTYHVTGWKVGYCIAPPQLTKEFRKVHQYLTFATTAPMQYALADYLANEEDPTAVARFYQQKRDHFQSLMQDTPLRWLPTRGTYFQLADYSAIKPDMADTEFARWCTEEVGVAVIPVSVFYQQQVDHKVVRFCFAKNEATLAAAAEKWHAYPWK